MLTDDTSPLFDLPLRMFGIQLLDQRELGIKLGMLAALLKCDSVGTPVLHEPSGGCWATGTFVWSNHTLYMRAATRPYEADSILAQIHGGTAIECVSFYSPRHAASS